MIKNIFIEKSSTFDTEQIHSTEHNWFSTRINPLLSMEYTNELLKNRFNYHYVKNKKNIVKPKQS
jgi:hypothetical protein